MTAILDQPLVLFAAGVAVQWLAAVAGDFVRKWLFAPGQDDLEDFDVVRAATLTLLALIVGFSFQMAVSRYDQRKNHEAAEANAIGTEYVRADLLLPEDAAAVRTLLSRYVEQLVLFYTVQDERQLGQVDADTAKLQAELWHAIVHTAALQPTPVTALATAGMNDVLNSQGFTQAAWWNRIPVAAWGLMGLIAITANLILGFGERRTNPLQLLVLPVVVSIAIFLIADIDSPRGGIIRVLPQNLIWLSQTMKPHP
jgi:hypothetical protein